MLLVIQDGMAEYYPRLAVAHGRQLHSDGHAVILPLRWSKVCQGESMVPGIRHPQLLAKAITLHLGLVG